MSDLSGERSQKSHGGSSLSIFSAVGTSSPSGTSDIGHVNAEELTDNSLAVLVEDASKAVRRLELETQMFTGVVINNILKIATALLIHKSLGLYNRAISKGFKRI